MSETPKDRTLAVALHYEKGTRAAPRIVAKGRGLLAERIVEIAQANDIVIEANPALAEALGAIELDDTIPLELYEAVAIVIGYVLQIGAKK